MSPVPNSGRDWSMGGAELSAKATPRRPALFHTARTIWCLLDLVRDDRADRVAETHSTDISGCHAKHANPQPVFAAERHGRGVHYPEVIGEEAIVADAVQHLGFCVFTR